MEHASLLWLQIPATDLKRAADFYTRVFGFNFFFEELNNIPHAVFKENSSGKKPVNGALIEIKDAEISPKGCVLFFDATGQFEFITENIIKCGGKILVPKTLIKKKIDAHSGTIPNTYIDGQPGYFVHFLDSEGNKMGLYGSN